MKRQVSVLFRIFGVVNRYGLIVMAFEVIGAENNREQRATGR